MRNFLRFSNLIFVKSNKYILLPLCVTLFISSCSSPNWLSMPSIPSVPNWIKPSTALSSVTNVFSRYTNSDDNKEKNSKVSLLDVPKKPSSLSVKDSDSTSKSLLADKKNAKNKNIDRGLDISQIEWFDDPVEMASSDAIDVFVELIGGESGVAKKAIEAAIDSGKSIVTANKTSP